MRCTERNASEWLTWAVDVTGLRAPKGFSAAWSSASARAHLPVGEDRTDRWDRGGSDTRHGRETGRRGSTNTIRSGSDGYDIR